MSNYSKSGDNALRIYVLQDKLSKEFYRELYTYVMDVLGILYAKNATGVQESLRNAISQFYDEIKIGLISEIMDLNTNFDCITTADEEKAFMERVQNGIPKEIRELKRRFNTEFAIPDSGISPIFVKTEEEVEAEKKRLFAAARCEINDCSCLH